MENAYRQMQLNAVWRVAGKLLPPNKAKHPEGFTDSKTAAFRLPLLFNI